MGCSFDAPFLRFLSECYQCGSELARDGGGAANGSVECDGPIASKLAPSGFSFESMASGLTPTQRSPGVEAEQVEDTAEAVIDHLRQALRAGVKRRNGRSDDPAHL